MIKNSKIKNFQALEDVEIDFHEGLNIVAGPSDTGKSSLVRALNWAFENRPQGFDFLSWSAKDGDSTNVEIGFDDGALIRERSNKVNQYQIGKTTFKALKSEVPPEVRALTKMDKYNLQEQEDIYFLLRDSAGERARKLNEISGLDIIDSTIKKANSIIAEAKKEAEWYSNKLSIVEKEIEGLAFLNKAGKDIAETDRLITSLSDKAEKLSQLEGLVEAIQLASKHLDDIEDWLQVEGEYKTLQKVISDLQIKTVHEDELGSLIFTIKDVQKKQAETNKWLRIQRPHKAIMDLLVKIEELREREEELDEQLQAIQDISDKILSCSNTITLRQVEYDKLASKIDRCPTCGQKVDKKTLKEHILKHREG